MGRPYALRGHIGATPENVPWQAHNTMLASWSEPGLGASLIDPDFAIRATKLAYWGFDLAFFASASALRAARQSRCEGSVKTDELPRGRSMSKSGKN